MKGYFMPRQLSSRLPPDDLPHEVGHTRKHIWCICLPAPTFTPTPAFSHPLSVSPLLFHALYSRPLATARTAAQTKTTPHSSAAMLIKVRTLTGKEIELDIEPDYKVSHLPAIAPNVSPANFTRKVSRIKERVEEKEGIPPVQQRLIYGGKQMYVGPLPFYGSRAGKKVLTQDIAGPTRRPPRTTSSKEGTHCTWYWR